MAFAPITPTSARRLRILFGFLVRNLRGYGWSGSLRLGRSWVLGVLGPWPLTRVSNIMVLDFKKTSPCSVSPAWDNSSSSNIWSPKRGLALSSFLVAIGT